MNAITRICPWYGQYARPAKDIDSGVPPFIQRGDHILRDFFPPSFSAVADGVGGALRHGRLYPYRILSG